MSELFSTVPGLQAIPIPDADVYYSSNFALGQPHEAILLRLISGIQWHQENIFVWGKTYVQPRLIAWYADEGHAYAYSGITLDPLPWTELLLDIRRRVENATGSAFNSVLLNYYRDNRDSMGLHSDDEPELGERPIIASLSLAEERRLVLKHKKDREAKVIRLRLASGSLLVMKGETQRNWKHGIEKETRSCGPRVNLTFRRILPSQSPSQFKRGESKSGGTTLPRS